MRSYAGRQASCTWSSRVRRVRGSSGMKRQRAPRIVGTDEERFLAKVAQFLPSDCWTWLAGKSDTGYGSFRADGRTWNAHQWAYEHWIGPVPDGLQLDHFFCNDRGCASPFHVRPVTQYENILRGNGVTVKFVGATRCLRGHLLEGHNLIINNRGHRVCRICENWRQRQGRMRVVS